MINENLSALIKKLRYKQYVSSNELQSIRLEILSYKNTPDWDELYEELRKQGVAYHFMSRTGLSGEVPSGGNLVASSSSLRGAV